MMLLILAALAFLLVGAVFVVILVVVLNRSQAQPAAPVLAPAPGGGLAPVPSTWHAQLPGSGSIGTLGSTYGTLMLDSGRLAFTRDDAAEPDWVVGCHELWVTRQGVGPFTIAGVRLQGPMGDVSCNVSQEHINRISTNTVKSFRESGYADQFVAALQAHGARLM